MLQTHQHSRIASFSSDTAGSTGTNTTSSSQSAGAGSNQLDEPVLVYHESARSIVFRDHLRRAVEHSSKDNDDESSFPNSKDDPNKTSSWKQEVSALTNDVLEIVAPHSPVRPETQIAGFQPNIVPLPKLELGPADEYQALYDSHDAPDKATEGFSAAEIEVCQMLKEQRCVVKTVKNVDWTDFLDRFHVPHKSRGRYPDELDDIPATADFHFNSFVTSTTLLPESGQKMRCFGSPNQYTVGVVFALPSEYANAGAEDEAAARTNTWSWPAGYSVCFCTVWICWLTALSDSFFC